jgi:uncharacterized protein (DUF2141 family)
VIYFYQKIYFFGGILKRAIVFLFLGCVLTDYCFSQTVITVEITNVAVNDGIVYVDIFSTADGFKNGNPYVSFELQPNSAILTHEISLPNGEYLISAYQDANNNQRLDYGLFGIPKELVGLSNYLGKGNPSKNFDKQKILVNNSTGTITIGLYRF